MAVSRRLGLLAGASSLLGVRRAAAGDAPPWMREQGGPAAGAPYGVPSPHEKNVVRRVRGVAKFPTASSSGTPLQDLHGIITPNGLHYERHHAGVPAIDPDAHRLLIHGLVDRPLIFTIDDIVRFPSVSRIHFLECSGNTPEFRDAKAGWTPQDTHGLLSCCEWTGVPLSTLLDEVGVRASAQWILAEGGRRGRHDPQHSDRQGVGRRDRRLCAERRAAARRTGLIRCACSCLVSRAT